jgi:hypothetical protein
MATKEKTEVAPSKNDAQLPAGMDLSEIMADAGAGVKDMGMDDIAVPYLYVLQPGSPQVNSDHEKYVEGAKSGMFYNNVSEEIYDGRDKGVLVIPCAYERKYVEWIDRDSGGGGYVADHDIDSNILAECKPNAKGIPTLGNGHIVIETAYHYVYFLNPKDGTWDQIIIPMKSTMLKKSRRWNKALATQTIPGTATIAPRWLWPWVLKTEKETKGDQTWSNFVISRAENMVDRDMYLASKAFAELFAQGSVKRATENVAGADVGEGSGKTVGDSVNKGDADEMPF